MSNWTLGTVTLPGDLQWTDEIWTERRQNETGTLNGGRVIQKSTQQAGRPVTITTPANVYVTRQNVLDLITFHDAELTDSFTVTLPDARTLICRFRHGGGLPVDAAPLIDYSPPDPNDYYTLTLRLETA